MRYAFAGLALLSVALGATALAAQGPSRDERPIRSWSEEQRDKAEHALYQDHDCRAALRQVNAAYDRGTRSRAPMDPRIALVKARAHDCLGQLPAAVAAYGLHDALSGTPTEEDAGLAGACRALTGPEGLPADPAAREALRVRLGEEATGVRRVLRRAAWEAGTSPTGESLAYSSQQRLMSGGGPDGTTMSRNQIAALWPRYISAWQNVPAHTAQGYRTSNRTRYLAASDDMERHLAELDATLICLEVVR